MTEIIDLLKLEIATEGGHWYLPDGTPYYAYINKKGEAKPVTLREARKAGAWPSSTGILQMLNRPGLNNYKEDQLFDAACTLEIHPGESRESYRARCDELAAQHSLTRRDRGSALHTAIEQWLRGDPHDPTWYPHIDKVVGVLQQGYDIDLLTGEPERSFAHPSGFGGKSDWHRRIGPVIIDFKTKDNKKKIESAIRYPKEFIRQLASYREGLLIPTARCLNVFVGYEDCEVIVMPWDEEDLQIEWRTFCDLLRIWQRERKYGPLWELEKGETNAKQ